MRTHTDDTRVDGRRSSSPRVERHSETTVPTAPPNFDLDDDEDDKETLLCARLPWPEPPISLSERPRMQPRPTGRTLPTGLSRSIATPLARHPAYWRLLALAAVVAASAPIFMSRPHASPAAAPAIETPAPRVVAPESKLAPPPLVITVGRVSPAQESAARSTAQETVATPSTAPAQTSTTRAPIDVTKLPIAPRVAAPAAPPKRVTKPPTRVKSAPSAAPRATAERDGMAAHGAAIDDGF